MIELEQDNQFMYISPWFHLTQCEYKYIEYTTLQEQLKHAFKLFYNSKRTFESVKITKEKRRWDIRFIFKFNTPT